MKRASEAYIARTAEVVFHPALTPMEAAMLPAEGPHPAIRTLRLGALRMARASFSPGRARQTARVRLPKLQNWGPQRQKI